MRTPTKQLMTLTAADLMTPTVITIPRAMSLQGAAHLLSQAQVTGAPVVDTQGRCVGVLSATDFVHWADQGGHPTQRKSCSESYHSAWQIPDLAALPQDEVSRYMTADPVQAAPNTPIGELAGMMVDTHIHRVIVVDEQSRPTGIVSSTDILAAVAFADKEAWASKRQAKEITTTR